MHSILIAHSTSWLEWLNGLAEEDKAGILAMVKAATATLGHLE